MKGVYVLIEKLRDNLVSLTFSVNHEGRCGKFGTEQ